MARICIITPGQIGSNPRVVKEAQAFVDAGHEVHVIATKVAQFVEPRDQAILAEAIFNVERVNFNDRTIWRNERALQLAARSAWALLPNQRLAPTAYSAMTRRLATAALATPADLYVAHYVAALPAASRAARRHGAIYAFDAEDFHPGDLPDEPQHDFERRLIRAIEAEFLPHAAYLTAAAPGIAEAYASEYGLALPVVILNTFSKKYAPPERTVGAPNARSPSLYWFSQTIGYHRGLECAVDAIALAKSKPHLHLRGSVSGDYANVLLERAAKNTAADRVHFHTPASPAEMVALAAEHDLGLVGETGETKNRRIALTNKQFTYLLAGVPAIMSDVQAHVAFHQEAQGATFLYEVGNARSLAKALDTLLDVPARLADARAQARALAQERFNWEHEAPKLLRVVEAALRLRLGVAA